ncbi:MAG: ATP-binding protein [Candidatus Micrarchaeota archaeon]
MVIKINEKIRRMLVEFNPFWKGKHEFAYVEREIYKKISKRMGERQIIALCGLRRVGKSTLLNKIISDLLKTNPPDSIMYFSFDDFAGGELLEIIDEFMAMHGREPKFLLLDEVQKLGNWAEKVKVLYDSGKYRIFASGSESLFLLEGSRESLAGRIYEFEVEALSFAEYLKFRGKEGLAKKPLVYDAELRAEFEGYVMCAGFPEIIGKKDAALVRDYIKDSVVEKIVFKDMKKLYPIENPQILISMLNILADNPGMVVDFDSFSRELGISRQTVSKYFDYLERAHLVKKLYNFSRNRATSEKRLKKYYPSFLSPALSGHGGEEYFSKLVEAVCILRSGAKYFWRDKRKNEIDMILAGAKGIMPVEIKYRAKPERENALVLFCKKYKCKKAMVITKNFRKKVSKPIKLEYMPVYEFLLGKGN